MRPRGPRPIPRWLVLAAWWPLAVAACTGGSDGLEADGGSGSSDDGGAEGSALPCRIDDLGGEAVVHLTGADPVAVAATVAGRTHRCADTVVVAPAGDGWAATLAATVAIAADAPLLVAEQGQPERVVAEAERLDAQDVVAVGLDAEAFGDDAIAIGPTVAAPAGTSPGAGPVEPGGADDDGGAAGADDGADGGAAAPAPATAGREVELALAVVDHLEATDIVATPVADDPSRMAALAGLRPGQALVPLPTQPADRARLAPRLAEATAVTVLSSDPATAQALAAELSAAGVSATAGEAQWAQSEAEAAWLADPVQGVAAAVAATAAVTRGEPLLPMDLSDLRNGRDRTGRLRAVGPAQVALVGDATADAVWQLPLVLEGPELPGGGFRLFDDERMVALYGHPISSTLGALGEQDLDATVERTRQAAEPYGADGARVLPAFEIIATVASAEAGAAGDYSRRTAIDVLRPYIDRAAAEGFYVVLDLQSGRTDFLTQAKEYQELLLEPHVGLALDPEWRLGPDERHLRQIGSVQAAEVQEVANWLAAFTRENQLPEKLLVLHQFQLRMLPDRDTIVAPTELAVVVHMDGQGPIGTKDGTYDVITSGAEDRWLWGWKNFYDEDIPTPSPEHVLALEPTPVFVTYQ